MTPVQASLLPMQQPHSQQQPPWMTATWSGQPPWLNATWSGLSCSLRPFRFLTLDQLAGHLQTGPRQIAVVASSGNLLGSGLGRAIDEMMVIRVNDAPTAQHEQDVGSQTALRYGTVPGLTNALSDVRLSAHEVLAVQPGMPMWTDPASMLRDLTSQNSCQIPHLAGPDHPVALINTSWLVAATSQWVNSTAPTSTGFGALVFALALAVRTANSNSLRQQICSELVTTVPPQAQLGAPPPIAYGYGPCPGCAKYHACGYDEHPDESDGLNGYHPYNLENEAIREWAGAGMIRLGMVTSHGDHSTPKSCQALNASPAPSPRGSEPSLVAAGTKPSPAPQRSGGVTGAGQVRRRLR